MRPASPTTPMMPMGPLRSARSDEGGTGLVFSLVKLSSVHPCSPCLFAVFLGIVLPNWSICIRGFSTFVHLTGPSMSYIFICWGTKFNGHHGDHTEWHLAAKGDTLRRSLGLAQTGRRLSEEKVAVFAGFLRVDVSPVSDPKRYSMGLRLVECFCLPKTELWYWYIFVL